MNRFCHYELRTTDTQSARVFYTAVLGSSFWSSGVGIGPLPAPAIARGAVPHWLGQIRVDDVSVVTQRFISHGAIVLGPSTAQLATLRDPSGAVVALSSSAVCADSDRVAWHVLHAHDEKAASNIYSDLFDWPLFDAHDSGARQHQQPFGWAETTEPAGTVANTAQLPGVHAHWLFFFPTADLDAALDAVRAHGGRTLPVIAAYGQRLAPCEDAQGAAFGVSQRIAD